MPPPLPLPGENIHRLHEGVLRSGPGLKIIHPDEPWWGGGYCGVCGDRNPETLIARAVRWWDPDDGWRMSILCFYCHDDVRDHGPKPDHYAMAKREEQAARIDMTAEMADLDSAYTDDLDEHA